VPGVASVGEPEVRELDARYFDTASRSLAQAGFAVRRRSGGPDEGWHIKGPLEDGGRTEQHWPLGDGDPDAVPAAVLDAVAGVTREPLEPLARIRNHRTAYALRGADGGLVAEFVDDRVSATDVRAGVDRAWREWEVELGPAAPADHTAVFEAVSAAVHAVGGVEAASASKLARTLGA
jgi:inorganic triphosphatase YgiF